MDSQNLVRVLAEVAETASETLELQEVFTRVAASVRRLIPFDDMAIVRIQDGEQAVLHASTLDCGAGEPGCVGPVPLSTWSPRLRPRPGPIARVDDAATELDPSFPRDADILASGVRSALWEPFRAGAAFTGGVWLSANRPGAFTNEHQELLGPIATLLSSAVEHWRIWDAERHRRERLDRVEVILETLAGSLDVRQVFGAISEAVNPVVPHDLLVLTEIDERAESFRVVATAGGSDIEPPAAPIALTPAERERRALDYDLLRDIPADLEPGTERNNLMRSTGMRSWLRVPIWLAGEVRGSVGFFHREPGRYALGDVEVARRIADRIALALSYRRLAEEARVAAEARERAERLEATVETLSRELEAQGRRRVVGVSRTWKEVLMQVGRVAPSETTVLITGESGTGKEVVARLVHQGSPRAGRPFVAINCAALPEQLLESELFGHEKGAFTGAAARKIGRLEQAAGGTLFLDEIVEMSPFVQAKFLRVLENREFQPLGATRPLRADVRVLAATNRDLHAAIARGQFREDLFYRLNVFGIAIPPLRRRAEDILPLAEAFLEDLGRSMGRPAAGISRDARSWLLEYPWPGNVRELRNAVERAILLCDGGLITRDHLPRPAGRGEAAASPAAAPRAGGNGPADVAPASPGEGLSLEAMDSSFVERALREAGGNKSRAARLLGLTRSQLYSRLEKYGIR
jgi:transcriptional regulator with GAF, ATPase, and Fis domain